MAGSAVAVKPVRTQACVPRRDRDRDRQVRLAQAGHRRAKRAPERCAWRRPGSWGRPTGAARPPSRPGRPHRRAGSGSGQVVAHVREVALLARPRVVGPVVDDVAHHLDAGGRAPAPRPLGAEDARAVEVHAALPARQGVRRDLSRPVPAAPRARSGDSHRRTERPKHRWPATAIMVEAGDRPRVDRPIGAWMAQIAEPCLVGSTSWPGEGSAPPERLCVAADRLHVLTRGQSPS